MDAHPSCNGEHEQLPWWRTRSGLVLLGFLAIGTYFPSTEHLAR